MLGDYPEFISVYWAYFRIIRTWLLEIISTDNSSKRANIVTNAWLTIKW